MSHISSSSSPLDIDELIKKDKYMDLLFNVIKNELDDKGKRIINRVKWMKIAGILLCNGYDMQVFLKICSPLSNPQNQTSIKLWKHSNLNILMKAYLDYRILQKKLITVVTNYGYKRIIFEYKYIR